MCTKFTENNKIILSLALGANGYIEKTIGEDRILQAITDVMNGGTIISPAIGNIIKEIFTGNYLSDEAKEKLTEQELSVLLHITEGYQYWKIGKLLDLSEVRIKQIAGEIIKKLQVKSIKELLLKWNRLKK